MEIKLLLAFAVFSTPGIAAELAFPPKTVAEVIKLGSSTVSLRVSRSGRVDYYLNGLFAYRVAVLPRSRIKALQSAADRLVPEELTTDEEPRVCNNPTATLYRVARSKSSPLTLVRIENCRKFHMASRADRDLKHILQGLEALADLK